MAIALTLATEAWAAPSVGIPRVLGRQLTDIVASLVSAAAVVALLQIWSPNAPASSAMLGGPRARDRRRCCAQ